MKWTDIPVHVIDFEGSLRTGVVEFGIVTLIGGAIAAVETRLCRGRQKLPLEETRVHGLTDGDLTGTEPFDAEWSRFAALREGGVLAAHFSATENRLLRAVWSCPRLSPDFLVPGREVAEWGPWIDTGRLASEHLPKTTSAGLESVVDALRLEPELAENAVRLCPKNRARFHCALFDALASALVLLRLAREESGKPWSLARLLAQSTSDPAKRDERSQARLF